MYELCRKLLLKLNESPEQLTDIIGYFESFEEDDSSDMLSSVSMVFEENIIHITAQEDDSLKVYSEDGWHPNEEFRAISLMTDTPWLSAKNKPLLWTWMLYNQYGTFDGLQMEFAEDTSDESSVVIQLVAIGSEIMYREVPNKCNAIRYA